MVDHSFVMKILRDHGGGSQRSASIERRNSDYPGTVQTICDIIALICF